MEKTTIMHRIHNYNQKKIAVSEAMKLCFHISTYWQANYIVGNEIQMI